MPKFGVSSIHHTLEKRLLKLLDDYHRQQEHRMTRISMQAYQLFLDLQQSIQEGAGRSAVVLLAAFL
jgi:hypothetical protein